MVSKIKRNHILERAKFKRFVRPTNYTIIMLFISVYLFNYLNNPSVENVDIIYISVIFTILTSISYYLGYYHPKNSIRRAIFLLISSIFILIDVCLVALTAVVEIEIEGVGTVIIDTRALFIAPIIILSINVFKNIIDLFDSWKNKNAER